MIDIISELRSFGIEPIVHDPLVSPAAAAHEYGVTLAPLATFAALDALVVAVPHSSYRRTARDCSRCFRQAAFSST